MQFKKSIARWMSHIVFQPAKAKRKFLLKYCSKINSSKVLEIGSGKKVNGELIYSVAGFFKRNHNSVVLSDANPEFGHRVVDITKSVPRGFGVIVCFNVLEHVFDFHSGIRNIYRALDKNGRLFVLVPAFYPLHDEPHDYWRYTEHSLRKLLSKFRKVEIDYYGKRELPFFYFAAATK